MASREEILCTVVDRCRRFGGIFLLLVHSTRSYVLTVSRVSKFDTFSHLSLSLFLVLYFILCYLLHSFLHLRILQALTWEKDSAVPPALTRNTFADLMIAPLENRIYYFPCLTASGNGSANLKSYYTSEF